MKYSDATSLGILLVLLLITFGFSYLVLTNGLEIVGTLVEKFEMIKEVV